MSEPKMAVQSSEDSDLSNSVLLRWMLGLCWVHRGWFLLAIVLQTLLALFAVFGLNLIGLGVDYLASVMGTDHAPPHWPLGIEPPSTWEPMQVLFAIAGTAVVVAVIHGILQYGAARSVALLVHGRIAPNLQNRVFAKLQSVCMRFYADNTTGSVINRATGDVQAVRSFVDLALMEAVTLSITFIVYAIYMFNIHAGLAAACLSIAPLMAVASAIFSRVTRPLFMRYREGFDTMILYLSETIRGAQVIKGFSLEGTVIAKMHRMNRDLWDRQQRIFKSISFFAPSINLLNHAGMFVLLLFGGRLVIQGDLALGTGIVVFAGLLQQYSNRISNVAQIANALQESLTGARRLREILGMQSSLLPAAEPQLPAKLGSDVEFSGVSASYKEGREVITGVDFRVESGEMVALVGETGSGKSALFALIPRLYDPSSGSLLIGGVDLRELDLEYLRRKIGVVFQDSFLFNDTVLENIRFGREDVSFERIRKAAEIAQAAEFIEKLDKGYDTVIGEFGIDLSGGQRQRLSIARALVDDPSILLLDDPTSAIDPSTEAQILSAMRNAIKGRTTFIIAHRVSTLMRADKIVILQGGSMQAVGTHHQLLATNSVYRDLVSAQSHELMDKLEASVQ